MNEFLDATIAHANDVQTTMGRLMLTSVNGKKGCRL